MNTTARIESMGEKNRVHLSKETAHLLHEAGKGTWLFKREDKVVAKGKISITTLQYCCKHRWLTLTFPSTGKGELETYWLNLSCCGKSGEYTESGETSSTDDLPPSQHLLAIGKSLNSRSGNDEKIARLTDWNVEILTNFLKEIERCRRRCRETNGAPRESFDDHGVSVTSHANDIFSEFVEVIHLPNCSNKVELPQAHAEEIELNDDVVSQLRHYVAAIATMYRENPFHNFEVSN